MLYISLATKDCRSVLEITEKYGNNLVRDFPRSPSHKNTCCSILSFSFEIVEFVARKMSARTNVYYMYIRVRIYLRVYLSTLYFCRCYRDETYDVKSTSQARASQFAPRIYVQDMFLIYYVT
jgi:hypothetical protein